jgi:hypothetical protein
MEGTKKGMTNFIQDIGFPGRDSNRVLSEYKSETFLIPSEILKI